jgi:natural product precursor
MKKISLKNVENTLSRKEMRSISGGSGGSGCCIAYGSGAVQWSCGYSVSSAQAYYRGGGRGYCCSSC